MNWKALCKSIGATISGMIAFYWLSVGLKWLVLSQPGIAHNIGVGFMLLTIFAIGTLVCYSGFNSKE